MGLQLQRTTFVARSSGLRLGQQENDGWSREGMVILSDFHGFPFAICPPITVR